MDILSSRPNDSRFKHGNVKPSERGTIPRRYPAPQRENEAVFLYVAYCRGYAKIGISLEPRKRIGSMQTNCPFPIELLASYSLSSDNATVAERAAMVALEACHWYGEWFKCTRNHVLYVVAQVLKEFPAYDGPLANAQPRSRFPLRARPIITPDGVFESATAAAARYGVSRQAVYAKAARGSGGWRFKL